MNNQRFQPYTPGRRPYRSWQRSAVPVPPPTTAIRLNQGRNSLQHQPAAELNNAEEALDPDNPPEPVIVNSVQNDYQEHYNDQDNSVQSFNSNASNSSISSHSENTSSGASDTECSESTYRTESSNYSEEQESFVESDAEDWEPTKVPNLENQLPNANCTKFECLLMILNLSLRHGLTQSATEDLCKLMNQVLGGNYIPTSKYMFRKIFGNSTYQFHFYCSTCESYLGSIQNLETRTGLLRCAVCQKECNISTMNNGHFFITFPLKEQLKFLLETTHDVLNVLEYRWNRTIDPGDIDDIFDGKIYSSLAAEGKFLSNHFNYSLTFGVDGAQVFDSTKNTLWPLLFRINEFPPSVRFSAANIMVGGIWFGKTEPSMPLFLSTFVREIKDLHENGFTWHTSTGMPVKSKFILLNCVSDSKAKPLVQCVKVHSGFWGCGYCLYPGIMYEGSMQAKYPLNGSDLALMNDFSFTYSVEALDPQVPVAERVQKRFVVVDRTNDGIRRDMELAEQNRNQRGEGDVKGVKSKSVLYSLTHFDLVFGFVIDYLHGTLIGVAKHVAGLWLNSSSTRQLYYIGLSSKRIDERLLNIHPPKCISRRPRSVSDMCHWKANEWRSWLLFYSLPCLVRILPARYLQHHCLLVSAIHLLLQETITRQDLTDATSYLGAYCAQFSVLYSDPMVFFNVHLLLHLGKCVDLWGPLFCYSAFSFESANGALVKLVKGSRGVLSQIAEKYARCKVMPKLLNTYFVSEKTLSFCEDLMCFKTCRESNKFDRVTVLGPQKYFPMSDDEEQIILAAGHLITTASYERMIIRNTLYHARCYRRKGQKTDSSVVKLSCGSYGVIERIIDPAYFGGQGDPKLLLLLRKINITRESVVTHRLGAKAKHIKMCGLIVYGDYFIATPDNVYRPAILMNCIDRTYVADFPNIYEKD